MIQSSIGVLLYTYNRVNDAKINLELIRHVWSEQPKLKKITIVHAYNGDEAWYPEKTLEDTLIRLPNSNHFQGATELLDAGMATFAEHHSSVDFVVVLAADTWLTKPNYLAEVLQKMTKQAKSLATCSWGHPDRNELFDVGMALDFFIVDQPWANQFKMFPLRYQDFFDKYAELFRYQGGSNVSAEKLALARFIDGVFTETQAMATIRTETINRILRLTEREPVHSKTEDYQWIRTHAWPELGLLTDHDPKPKQILMRDLNLTAGPELAKFLAATNLDYFNNGVR